MTLVVTLLGYLTLPMSMSGTTVALPRIGADLGASGPALQWVITGYFLSAASFMLVAGSLGDLFGRRRVFTAGAALWSAGMLAGATAPNILVLDIARTLSGVGASGVMACGGALLAGTFQGAARTRAFATMGTIAGVGLALGPTLSGALVGALGWRMTFGVFVAAGLVLLAGTTLMAESRAEHRPRVDRPGIITFISGLALVMYGLTQGSKAGWTSPLVLAPVLVGTALLTLFVRHERRTDHPVLDLSLLRNRRFMGWCLAALGMSLGTSGLLVFLPTYLQGVNHASARDAGLTMLMLTAPVLVVPPLAGRLVNRGLPARHLIVVALLLMAAGNAWLTVLHPGIGPVQLLGPLLTAGAGNGLAAGMIDAQAMNLVEAERTGMAAGFLNTVKGGSNALLLTVVGAALTGLIQARVGGSAELAARVAAGELGSTHGAFLAAQFTGAWHTLLWAVAALLLTAALTVHRLLDPSRSTSTERPAPGTTAGTATRTTARPTAPSTTAPRHATATSHR
ncbi:MFS transporter [Streptomyces sp. MST-110588]|uniref:MFS transporter n=1 Tax=Streptomyces sp. MST-110588 TaxID=2833628 RepID=UPI001F5D8E69|nr:MFS transporter [Streptomyces sp. MST-110588]